MKTLEDEDAYWHPGASPVSTSCPWEPPRLPTNRAWHRPFTQPDPRFAPKRRRPHRILYPVLKRGRSVLGREQGGSPWKVPDRTITPIKPPTINPFFLHALASRHTHDSRQNNNTDEQYRRHATYTSTPITTLSNVGNRPSNDNHAYQSSSRHCFGPLDPGKPSLCSLRSLLSPCLPHFGLRFECFP